MGRAAAVAADTGDVSVSGLAGIIQWPWTLTRPQRPQTPGGRIRALGFAPWGARRRSPPIPAMCQYQGSPVSSNGLGR